MSFQKNLSDELVPVISKKILDIVVTDFLKRHYPSALDEPRANNLR